MSSFRYQNTSVSQMSPMKDRSNAAGKRYEKYFLFRWTAGEMSDGLQAGV